uniref:Proteasome subunit beta type-3 n=1 Tax=Globodera pallida TaxID=36090 RepID=A0A183BWD0_GLOPA
MPHIMDLHGGTVITMKTKNCVVIASDLRLGQNTMTNIATNVTKVHPISDKVFVGLTGFNADASTVLNKLRAHDAIYEMREQRPMSPKVLMSYLAWVLYKRRFGSYLIQTMVAGLNQQNEAYIASTDVVGSVTEPEDYSVGGSGGDLAMSLCEALWRPDLTSDELTVAVSQAMLAVVERDASTGWGIVVHTITADGVTSKTIKSRMD